MDLDVEDVPQRSATGRMPAEALVEQYSHEAYSRAKEHSEGVVADYIPALAKADSEWFGIAVAGVDGSLISVGDTKVEFSIQSISKAFVYALLCERLGHETALQVVGVNNTGLPFNSVIAIELNDGHPMNPMVNAGAIATTAMVPGANTGEQWDFIKPGLDAFAGRSLSVDDEVFESEMASNDRNLAIARLLYSYGRIKVDPEAVVEVYTRQCSLNVTAEDLAIMGATLADGGSNPVTGVQVVSREVARDTLAVMASAGLYENSGEWLFDIGLPGKSGVAGGLVTVAPGKVGIGCFAPPLDPAGNSVRGQIATAYLSKAMGLNIFASDPYPQNSSWETK